MTWEEKIQLAAQIEKNAAGDEEIYVVVKIADREVRQWMNEHSDKMGPILGNFIVDIYKANQIIKG